MSDVGEKYDPDLKPPGHAQVLNIVIVGCPGTGKSSLLISLLMMLTINPNVRAHNIDLDAIADGTAGDVGTRRITRYPRQGQFCIQ